MRIRDCSSCLCSSDLLSGETRRMVDRLYALAAAIELRPDGAIVLAAEPSYPLFHRPYSGMYCTVMRGAAPPLRSWSLWDAELALSSTAPRDGKVHATSATGPGEQPLLA